MRELRQRIIQVLRDGTDATGEPVKAKDVIQRVLALYGFTSENDRHSLACIKKEGIVSSVLSRRDEDNHWERVGRAQYAPLGWASKKERGAV